MKKGIIYKWTCLDTGKSYIGQTINPKERFKRHLKLALTTESKSPFYIDLAKYSHWTYTVLEENIDRGELLNEKELFYINEYNSIYPNGYNIRYGGSWKKAIVEFSEHHKQALKDSWTEERRKKASETQKQAQLNYWSSKEGIEKAKHHSDVMKGRKQSEEERKKRSESLKGREVSIETRNKIGNANRGRTSSEATRKKLSDSHKGKAPGNKGKHRYFNKETQKYYYM